MKKSLFLCLLALILISCNDKKATKDQAEATTEEQDFYHNPILAGWYPDPAITDDGKGNYYMVHSTFAFYPGIPIFHSTDLVNWKQIGHVLDRPEQLDLEGFGVSRAIFAPDISYDGERFYVTCTVVDGKGNFVVTADDPAGPWSDPVWLPEVIGIDPGLFFDEDKSYLVYNSDAPENKPLYQGHRTIRMVEFDKENLEVVSDNRILVNGGVDLSEKPIWAEGPRIYKLNGYYYLMTAEGGTAIDHSEVIYRTKDINTDFEPWDQNPILTQRDLDPSRENPITSAGHADIVQTENGEWYGVFLACRDYGTDHYNTGRETFMTPVRWEDDWPVFDLGGDGVKYKYPLPEGVTVNEDNFPLTGNFTVKEEFDTDSLGYHWMYLRTVHEPWHSFEDGALQVETRPEDLAGTSNPSFIGRRQQHLNGSASISLDFIAQSENESAGLVAFQNESYYYYICKSLQEGEQVVQLRKANSDGYTIVESAALEAAEEAVELKIDFGTDAYTFSFRTAEDTWQQLGEGLDPKYLSMQVAGGFVGVTLAMYTSSEGEASDNTASFNWFEYVGDDEVFE